MTMMRARRIVAWITVALIALGGAFLGYVEIRSSRVVLLPVPAGPHQVGRRIVTWTEPMVDPLATDHGQRRISVWLWYPAQASAGSARSAYAPGAWGRGMRPGIGERLLARPVGRMRVAARDNAPTAPGQFPLVVLAPGMGNNPVQQTVVASGLASHGYVVAVPSPTYSADVTVLKATIVRGTAAGQRVPGNESVLSPLWVQDELFTTDRLMAANAEPDSPFYHHIQVAKVAYAGHSFGGATAVQSCSEDQRCAAAVDVDGAFFGAPVTRTGLNRPLLIIASQGSCVAGRCSRDAADREQLADAKALLQHSTDVKDVVEVRGAQHANFTDLGVWYFAEPARFALQATGVFGRIDGDRALRAEIDCLDAFLDTQLRGTAADSLTTAIARNPDAKLILG